jgi:hypothetical protein
MINMKAITRGTLKRCIEHQDVDSERHHLDRAYQNSGVTPDDWLKSLKSTVVDFAPSITKSPSTKELIAEIRARSKKGRRKGRAADELGFRWIYNPCDEIQSRLRALSKLAPDLFLLAHRFLDRKVELTISQVFPGAIGRRAFHSDTGRWHEEGTICKLAADGRVLDWAPGFLYDKADLTAHYETRLQANAPIVHLRSNSRMAVQFHRAFHSFMEVMIEPELRRRNQVAEFKAACLVSHQVLMSQTLRREMGFVLTYPNPRSVKVKEAKDRIEKWTVDFDRLFPEAHPPTFKDFSLLGLFFRTVDASRLSPAEKTSWKEYHQSYIVSYFRSCIAHHRPHFDKNSTEMDDALLELALKPLRQFAAMDKILQGQYMDEIDAGCLLERGVDNKALLRIFSTVMKAAEIHQFLPLLIAAYDRRQPLPSLSLKP